MKKTILALSMLAAGSAHAVDFEIGTGVTSYKTNHDGLWYQEQYPHTLDLQAVPMSIGVSFKPGNTRYRAEYLNLGWIYSNAQFTYDETYYPGTTAAPVGTMLGRGQVGGLVLSASRDVPVLGVPFYAEAGGYLYSHNFKILVTSLSTGAHADINASSQMAVGYIVGLGVRHSGVDIGVRYIDLSYNGEMPKLVNRAYTMMVKVYF